MSGEQRLGIVILSICISSFLIAGVTSMMEVDKNDEARKQIQDHCLKEVGGCLVEFGEQNSPSGNAVVVMSHLFTNCGDDIDLSISPSIGEFVKANKGEQKSHNH